MIWLSCGSTKRLPVCDVRILVVLLVHKHSCKILCNALVVDGNNRIVLDPVCTWIARWTPMLMENGKLSRQVGSTPCRVTIGTVRASEQIATVVFAVALLTFGYGVGAVYCGSTGQEARCTGTPLVCTVLDIG